MFQNVKVVRVMRSRLYDGLTIEYHDDKDNMDKYAACVEGLYPNEGDTIEIYHDDEVHYKGFSCMALKIIR